MELAQVYNLYFRLGWPFDWNFLVVNFTNRWGLAECTLVHIRMKACAIWPFVRRVSHQSTAGDQHNYGIVIGLVFRYTHSILYSRNCQHMKRCLLSVRGSCVVVKLVVSPLCIMFATKQRAALLHSIPSTMSKRLHLHHPSVLLLTHSYISSNDLATFCSVSAGNIF